MARTRTKRDADVPQEDAATRHLCVGVYLERAFRWKVLHRVHNDPARVVPPSYGFALNPVITHAWLAWSIETVQHAAVLAVLVVGLIICPAALVALAGVLALWFMAPMALKYASIALPLLAKERSDRLLRRSRLRSEGFEVEHQKRMMVLYAAGCAVVVVALPLAGGFAHLSAVQLSRSVLGLVVPVVVVVACGGAVSRAAMNDMHNSGVVEPRWLTHRQRAIAEQQSRPYVIYRRPPSPAPEPKDALKRILHPDEEVSQFVGAGKLVHQWLPPLTVPLLPVDADPDEPVELREYATPPFASHDLVRRLASAVRLLADEEEVTRLPGLTVTDRLYVAEAEVAHRPAWLWEKPSERKVDEAIDDPHGLVHHFLEASAPVRGGELVITVFLRVTVKGRTLSLDFAACALTRTPDAYHILEGHRQSGIGSVLLAMLRRVRDLPVEVAHVWRLVEVPPLLLGAVLARTGRPQLPLCGATSIREDKATPWERAQLDESVIRGYIKIIEGRLLATTEDFLAACKVDTSVFHSRAQQIINQGVLNMGRGSIRMDKSAAGPGAQFRDEREMPNGSKGAE